MELPDRNSPEGGELVDYFIKVAGLKPSIIKGHMFVLSNSYVWVLDCREIKVVNIYDVLDRLHTTIYKDLRSRTPDQDQTPRPFYRLQGPPGDVAALTVYSLTFQKYAEIRGL
uniref:Uncharacterized protein n=1 Tax=uncultured marine virus TaxID=186617 RepID=A0A0F7L642_9VIRU|nr:hypothetical protein [uncultured marine virus]